ncbi:phosphoribosyltransferase, partial [Psychrobacter pacificensis]|uniref:phosphoribosyltransferase n=1 Tax=Psychrobacter pacificensis TaxID=112002 RepID=UPI003CFFD8BC
MKYKSFANLSQDIIQNLFKLHSENYDLVVGIPRSGMIPAYMIGLYLNINVTSLDAFIENRKLTSGITRKTKTNLVFAQDAKRVLLVDDSINTGKSLVSALGHIPEE